MISKEAIQENEYIKHGAYHRVSLRITESRQRYNTVESILPHDLSGLQCFDFGGGDGMMATLLANRGASVTVGDMSHLALTYACESDSRIRAVQLRTNLPFPANQFAVVTMLETLEHIPDEEEMVALQEAYRVIQPEGYLLISVPSDNKPVSAKHYRHYSVVDLYTKLENTGFQVSNEYHLGQYLMNLRRFGIIGKLGRTAIYHGLNAIGKKNINIALTAVDSSKAHTHLLVAKKLPQ